MEINVQQPQKKKSKLKDVPVTVYRIIEVPPNIEGVTKTATIKIVPKSNFDEGTATIQLVPKSEFDDEVSDQISAGDQDKVNVTVTTSFVIDDDNTVKQHSTSKVIRLPIPIQHGRQHNVLSEASDTGGSGSGSNFILERNFMCTVCSKTFKHSSHLKRHINTHTGERVYKCDLCDKTFLDASTLSRHRKIHSGDKPWSCKICKKSFGTLGSLRRHITVHNQEGRPYQCETCKKRFPDNSSYQKHKFIHTGIKPYGCDVCGKSFVHIGDLNGHRKIHVEVKPYNCERCGKDFAKHSNYARHLLIHEGDKEFSCTICGVSYNFQSSLTRHLLTHVRKGNKASGEASSTSDENQDFGSQGSESSQETDEPTMEISDRKVVSNQIKVTRTKMNNRNKLKQLRRLQVLRQSDRRAKSLSSLAVSDPPPADAFDLKHTETVIDELVVSDLIEADPTVLPPQDELISKQTTTEDVTTLLSSAEDFGSTKDIPQPLLQPRIEPVGSTSSGSLLSLLSNSTESECVLPINESDEMPEVQISGNKGAIISDPNSVITVISISDDSVTNVGNIAPSTSVSDCSDVVVAVLESTETDDVIAGTIFSDIHGEDHNNGDDEIKEFLNGGSSRQMLVKVSDTKAK